jgi:galactose mutarotase-like enzyme
MEGPKTKVLELTSGTVRVTAQAGELVGLQIGDRDWMHKGSEPGWGHSDTEMFPIIGPTAETAYRVQVPKGNAIQDQHGLLREMEYGLVSQTDTGLVYEKKYQAGSLVPNSKHPQRSQAKWLIWPYTFRLTKTIRLLSNGVEVSFGLTGDKDMPYMIGYHPAFSIQTKQAKVIAGDREVTLPQVMDVGDRALELPDCQSLLLEDGGRLLLESSGFGHFMLWSPDPGMLCVEPISFYPYTAGPGKLHQGFRFLEEQEEQFTLTIRRAD